MKNKEVLEFVANNWWEYTASEIARKTGVSERTIRGYAESLNLPKKKSNAFQEILVQNNFTPPKWKDGWLKTDEASIRIVNQEERISYDQVRDELIKEMKKHSPKYKKIKRGKLEPHLLVLSPSDIHINKLAVKEETGDHYNIEIALERVHTAVNKILEKSETYKLDTIMLLIGNDVLHTDNKMGTTSGTPQDMDKMWHQAFKIARKMYVELIEQLVEVANVHIVHNPSNHDWYSGFFLADALYCWFHKHPNITWDIEIRHRKYYTYGKNLIGTSHGDGAKENDLPMLMATEAETWSQTRFRYFYLGHVHHKRQIKYVVGDKQQITIEYMRSPSGADSWHDRQGYVSPKSIEGFIHHKDNGQVARLSVNF